MLRRISIDYDKVCDKFHMMYDSLVNEGGGTEIYRICDWYTEDDIMICRIDESHLKVNVTGIPFEVDEVHIYRDGDELYVSFDDDDLFRYRRFVIHNNDITEAKELNIRACSPSEKDTEEDTLRYSFNLTWEQAVDAMNDGKYVISERNDRYPESKYIRIHLTLCIIDGEFYNGWGSSVSVTSDDKEQMYRIITDAEIKFHQDRWPNSFLRKGWN